MDHQLAAWGIRRSRARLPVLWLFTDTERLPDPREAVAHLPRGRAGVVFRHDSAPNREAIGRDLLRICRNRHLAMVVAGDPRLAARFGAGVHLRGGRWPGSLRCRGLVTSSAHSVADLRRAVRAKVDLVFLSPAFATSSHPGAPGLGPLRWNAMARSVPASAIRIAALGGVSGANVRRLSARCQAVGAITAFSR